MGRRARKEANAPETVTPAPAIPELNLQVTYVSPEEIKPDPRNARSHPRSQILQIMASVSHFGFANPILIDENGVVIAGHGRLIAAKKLGLGSVPTITLPHLTDLQKRALRLADNQIALNGAWSKDLLRIDLGALAQPGTGIDLKLLGFSSAQIDISLGSPVDPDDEAAPAPRPTSWKSAGTIVTLGEHRVGCGDARDLDFVKRVMGSGALADCAFLDIPFNVGIQGHANVDSAHPDFAMASGEMSASEFSGFIKDSLGVAAAVTRSGGVHYVCIDWRSAVALEGVGREVYDKVLNLCIWNKSNAGMGALYRSKHELIYVFKNGSEPYFNAVELGRHGRNRTNVWDYPSVNTFDKARREDLKLHPTVKPIAMVADAIKDVTRRGDVVLDTFLGSGTTLLAAEREGRRFRGVEIDPVYIDVAIERWVDLTGGKPIIEKA